MPCILVRNSMNTVQTSNSTSVAELAFSGKKTHVDSSFDKETHVAKKMEVALHPLSFEVK